MKKNKIGLWSATFLGISTIIGSGWLFAPYKAVQAAVLILKSNTTLAVLWLVLPT